MLSSFLLGIFVGMFIIPTVLLLLIAVAFAGDLFEDNSEKRKLEETKKKLDKLLLK